MAVYRLFCQLCLLCVTKVISLRTLFNACPHTIEIDFFNNDLLRVVLAMPAELRVASRFFFGRLVDERA
jgi:hypothetical protein